jgi:hypothetical protein
MLVRMSEGGSMTDEQCRATVEIAIKRGFCSLAVPWPKVVERAIKRGLCSKPKNAKPVPISIGKDPRGNRYATPEDAKRAHVIYMRDYRKRWKEARKARK